MLRGKGFAKAGSGGGFFYFFFFFETNELKLIRT